MDDLRWLFCSLDGRLNKKGFWLAYTILSILALPFLMVQMGGEMTRGAHIGALLAGLVAIPVYIKRGHDFGLDLRITLVLVAVTAVINWRYSFGLDLGMFFGVIPPQRKSNDYGAYTTGLFDYGGGADDTPKAVSAIARMALLEKEYIKGTMTEEDYNARLKELMIVAAREKRIADALAAKELY